MCGLEPQCSILSILSLYTVYFVSNVSGTLVNLNLKNESYAAIKTASLCKETDVLEDNSSKALISLISIVLFSMLPFIKFTFVFKVLPHY